MQLTKLTQAFQHVAEPLVQRPSNYSIIKRLANLVLVIVGLTVCINLWLSHSSATQNWYQQQANQLGRSLGQMTARSVAIALSNQNNAAMEQLLGNVADDPHVDGVALYNQKGQLIAGQDNNISVLGRYQNGQQNALVFVQEVNSNEGQLLGYLRLVLDESKVMQYHYDYLDYLRREMEVLIILAMLLAALLTRMFYTIRYRKYR